jgi:hypothetical protein
MRDRFSAPRLVVHHRQRVPQPILPVNYEFFLGVELPEHIATLSLSEQLSIAKTASARRRVYPCSGPFGAIVSFEFLRTASLSIYLNAEGDFAE